jgi:hypothetical protein
MITWLQRNEVLWQGAVWAPVDVQVRICAVAYGRMTQLCLIEGLIAGRPILKWPKTCREWGKVTGGHPRRSCAVLAEQGVWGGGSSERADLRVFVFE